MKMLNIVIPMAGYGSRFMEAGYTLPKPLIDVAGQTMIEAVIANLRPTVAHRFIFICLRAHSQQYDLLGIFKKATAGAEYEVILIDDVTAGAACTVLCAKKFINDDNDLIVANSDQYITLNINDFVADARARNTAGLIMTFESSHPKWSYARLDESGHVLETAEKKLISNHATVGIYYFSHGKDFIYGAEAMIAKNINHNGEYYVCPVYNELILNNKKIRLYPILADAMHGLGTPEDLQEFLKKISNGSVVL